MSVASEIARKFNALSPSAKKWIGLFLVFAAGFISGWALV